MISNLSPRLKGVLTGLAIIAVLGIVAVSQAVYQSIENVPRPAKESYFEMTLEGSDLPPGAEYRLSVGDLDMGTARVDEEGRLITSRNLTVGMLEEGQMRLRLTHLKGAQDRKSPDFMMISLDLIREEAAFAGTSHNLSREVAFYYPSNIPEEYAAGRVLRSTEFPDWSGRFIKTLPFAREYIANGRVCSAFFTERDAATASELCLNMRVVQAAEAEDVLLLSFMQNLYGIAREVTGDPYSPFSSFWPPGEGDEPGECEPYLVELGVCDEAVVALTRENQTFIIFDLATMTRQLIASMMQQAAFVGMLMDAKNQLETQLLLWQKQEEAMNDYQPSEQLCTIATLSKDIANAEERARQATIAFARAMDREDQNPRGLASGGGANFEAEVRWNQFTDTYCDPMEANNGMLAFCDEATEAEARARWNREVDFTRLVDQPLTLDVNYLEEAGDLTAEETDIMAMSRYLYGHPAKNTPQPQTAAEAYAILSEQAFIDDYMAHRSESAIRNIARHSFATLVGMKAEGTGYNSQFMRAVISDFGLNDDQITEFLGENPSYFAQMEVMTRTMFQHPTFYTNLIDRPSNVLRFQTSMEALRLMQDRDRYEQMLRRELLLALIVEMKLREHQKKIDAGIIAYADGDR